MKRHFNANVSYEVGIKNRFDVGASVCANKFFRIKRFISLEIQQIRNDVSDSDI